MSSSVSFQPPRRLRVFAFDPSTGNRYVNRRIREMTISLPWELDPVPRSRPFIGPDGGYLQVVDYDPASGVFYEPIDLNDPGVLHNDGLAPSEENPQFHQQMVYAVAMDTIAVFEQALGRVVLWSPLRYNPDAPDENDYVGQLRIYPHALREANAYYDPVKKALLFGYFEAGQDSRSAPPGTTVFTCLSHDIVVHETCHAILDGMHPRFVEASNPDMLALHEAFADIVAIFQHFSHPEVLADQIARTRGDLQRQSLLGALAQEFGQALGRGGALRDALGHYEEGEWQPREPDNRVLDRLEGPHARGAILVAAVFRAFLSIYRDRVADLFRIASNGTGILRQGEIDPDLVRRLAGEAATSARHLLKICIRAMDYCPPVDVDFGDYLRAIVTADHDLYPEDDHGYRRAIMEAFTAWGIVPEGFSIITEQALLWPELREVAADLGKDINQLEGHFGNLIARPNDILDELRVRGDMTDSAGTKLMGLLDLNAEKIVEKLNTGMDRMQQAKAYTRTPGRFSKEHVLQRNLLELGLAADREVEHLARSFYAVLFWGIITSQESQALVKMIGLTFSAEAPQTMRRSEITGLPTVWVQSVRMASRIGKRGQAEREYVVELIQSRDGYLDREDQVLADEGKETKARKAWRKRNPDKDLSEFRPDFRYRCGCTLLIDAESFEIRRVIRTKFRVDEDRGLERMRRYLEGASAYAENAFDDPRHKPRAAAFANLHRQVERRRF